MASLLAEQFDTVTNADHYQSLVNKINCRHARVMVIGQGYVGLPLAIAFARGGFKVNGLDVDAELVDCLQHHQTDSPDVDDKELAELTESGHYLASSDFDLLAEADVILICVPTPLRKSKDPDISYVMASAQRLVEKLRPGQLIILESTTYPGTTEELLLPLFESTGLRVGMEFFLAFSPERIDPGNTEFQLCDIPKITGGVSSRCTVLASKLYAQIVNKVCEVSSPKVAELAKLYENVFRSVNIALANEFSLICQQLEVNTREVIDAAASKPFGFMAFYPGPGIGGHCIPIDPAYLAWKMRFNNYQTRFIPLAEEINQSMPAHVIDLIDEALNIRRKCLNGARVLALGVAYKPGLADIRESPALQVLSKLVKRGVDISYADPFVPFIEINGLAYRALDITENLLASCDCVLILTDHPQFDFHTIVASGALIVDTRGATSGIDGDKNQIIRL